MNRRPGFTILVREGNVAHLLIVFSMNIVEQIIYFFTPLVIIVVGISFLISHKRRSPSLGRPPSLKRTPSVRRLPTSGRPIRPDGRKRPYSSEPYVVFSRQPVTQKIQEKQEVVLTAEEKPYSYDDAQPLAEAWLLIDGCGTPEKRFDINGMVISIGRSDDNDIVLIDKAVSLRHGKIKLEGKRYFIYDLASINGTRVNGSKIVRKWIKEGDTIQVGHTRMVFKTRENGDGLENRRTAARSQHLSGNLKYFDLPFIIQTLATSGRTGTLTITDLLKRSFAMLYFEAGDVLFAKMGHLRGEEAFYQLLQSIVQGSFTFKGGLPSLEFEDGEEIGTTTTGLLMEAARQQDELKLMKATYADANRVFRPQSPVLLWNDEETKDLAQEIWARLHRGETIAQMVRGITACEYCIYNVLSLMNGKGLVA